MVKIDLLGSFCYHFVLAISFGARMYRILFFTLLMGKSLLCASAGSGAVGAVESSSSTGCSLYFAEMPEDPARYIALLEDSIRRADLNMTLLKRNQSFVFSDPARAIFQALGTVVDPGALEGNKIRTATQLYASILAPYQKLCRELLECLRSQDKRKYAEILENIVYLYVDLYDFSKKDISDFKAMCLPLLSLLPQIRVHFANLNSICREQIGDLFAPFVNSASFHFKEAFEKKEAADRLVGRFTGQFPGKSAAHIVCKLYNAQMEILGANRLCGPEIDAFRRTYVYEIRMLEVLKERENRYTPQQVSINSQTFASVIDSYAQGVDGQRSIYPLVMNCGHFLAESLMPFVRFIEAKEAKERIVEERRARHFALMASGQRLSLERAEERRRCALSKEVDFLRSQIYEDMFGVFSAQRERDNSVEHLRVQVEEEERRLVIEEENESLFDMFSQVFFADYPYRAAVSGFMVEQKSPQSIKEIRCRLFQKTKLYDVLVSLRDGQTVKQHQLISAIKAFGELVPNGGSEYDIFFWSYDGRGQKIRHEIPRFDLRHGAREAEYNSRDLSGRGSLVMLIRKLSQVGYWE